MLISFTLVIIRIRPSKRQIMENDDMKIFP